MTEPNPSGIERTDEAVAEALAYEVWHYERPNEQAVAHARAALERMREAGVVVGVSLRWAPVSDEERDR